MCAKSNAVKRPGVPNISEMPAAHRVRRAQGGERLAFGELAVRYYPMVYGTVQARTRRPEDIEELVQEVFGRAFEELGSLHEPAYFTSWLRRIAANMTVSWWRRQQRGSEIVEQYALCVDEKVRRPDEEYERDRGVVRLRRAMADLAYPYRRVLQLYYWEGCSYAEIAAVLDVPASTVKWRLLHGRSQLKERLN